MEDADRDKILRNIDKLIQFTKYDVLMKQCIDRGLLFDVMKETIELNPDEKARHRELFKKITHRGPKAYNQFETILKEIFPDAAGILTHISYSYLDVSNRANGNNNSNFNTMRPMSPIERVPTAAVPVPSSTPTPKPALSDSNNTGHMPGRSTIRNGHDISLEIYAAAVNPTKALKVKKSMKFHETEKVSTYEMKSRNRGVLFLVNIINFRNKGERIRNGAHVDRDNLIELFRQMGFKVFYYEDITHREFLNLIDRLIYSQHLRATDCLVLGILSHGERDLGSLNVVFSDEQKIDVEIILEKFNNHNCPVLIGKPKIFLFPFCRGEIADPGVSPQRRYKVESDHLAEARCFDIPNIQTFSDMKICYATIPGRKSFRDPQYGSWYIEVMCEVWSEHAHDTHLDNLLKIVGNTLSIRRTEANHLQTSSNEDRGFHKLLYFNPGFYG